VLMFRHVYRGCPESELTPGDPAARELPSGRQGA
jgi:hypothetical protein